MVTADSYVYYDAKKMAYFALTTYSVNGKLLEPMKPIFVEHADIYDESKCKKLNDDLNK